jgi:hypothetical protein
VLRWVRFLVDGLLVGKDLTAGVVGNSSLILLSKLVKFIWVDPIFIVYTSIGFSNSYKFSSIFYKEFRSPVPYISKTLNNEGFAFKARLYTKLFRDCRMS